MKKFKLLLIISVLSVFTDISALSTVELSHRVLTISKKLGCEIPYMVAENSETGGFFAETKLKDPSKIITQGFPDAQKDHFVSIRE